MTEIFNFWSDPKLATGMMVFAQIVCRHPEVAGAMARDLVTTFTRLAVPEDIKAMDIAAEYADSMVRSFVEDQL